MGLVNATSIGVAAQRTARFIREGHVYAPLAFFIPWVCFLAGMSTATGNWDVAELQSVPWLLGIAHPTGFPLFILTGFALSHLLAFAFEPATSIGILCVTAGAAAVLAAYVLARTIGAARPFALAAALLLAGYAPFFVHVTRADVHDLALPFELAMLVFALRYRRQTRPDDLIRTALATGLALAAHSVAVLLLPAIAILIVPVRQPLRVLARAALALVAPVALYLYIPIRAIVVERTGADPRHVLGLIGQPLFDYGAPSSPARLWAYLTGAEYDKHAAFVSVVDVLRYPAHLAGFSHALAPSFVWPLQLLALAGLVRLALRNRRAAIALAIAALTPAFFVLEYGVESDPQRYLLLGVAILAALAAFAVDWFVRALPLRARLFVAPALAAAMLAGLIPNVFPIYAQRFAGTPDMSGYAVVEANTVVPDGSVIIADWNFSNRFGYEAYVRRFMGRRLIVDARADVWPHVPRWLQDGRAVYLVNMRPEAIDGACWSAAPVSGTNLLRVYRLSLDRSSRG